MGNFCKLGKNLAEHLQSAYALRATA